MKANRTLMGRHLGILTGRTHLGNGYSSKLLTRYNAIHGDHQNLPSMSPRVGRKI